MGTETVAAVGARGKEGPMLEAEGGREAEITSQGILGAISNPYFCTIVFFI